MPAYKLPAHFPQVRVRLRFAELPLAITEGHRLQRAVFQNLNVAAFFGGHRQ
jgi:hypothetical protein